MNTSSSEPSGPDSRRRNRIRGDRSWIAGLVLVLLGAILLVQRLSGIQPTNWWALFILIPAFGALDSAWRQYQDHGRVLSGSVTGSLITGLALLAVTAIFLFSLNWGTVWPIFLILAGAGALLGAILR